ncbi:MAG: hypothetical protein SAJ37_04820 [Oscillatoria sp. PMC 1068.18]|nr:hypothetical protein [Oscillatoria sp. PMC 1076.18]MEC4988052.1 hypothetical protein [Oscillatoria sp. PMC 1068.18]
MLAETIFLAIGIFLIGVGYLICEQVYAIVVVLSGIMLTVWGFAGVPMTVQIPIELGAILAIKNSTKLGGISRIVRGKMRRECCCDSQR